MRGDETVGLVVIASTTQDSAHVSLDYVTERFRDFSPGRFVYTNSGLFDRLGVSRIEAREGEPGYLEKMGFRRESTGWTRLVRPTGGQTH